MQTKVFQWEILCGTKHPHRANPNSDQLRKQSHMPLAYLMQPPGSAIKKGKKILRLQIQRPIYLSLSCVWEARSRDENFCELPNMRTPPCSWPPLAGAHVGRAAVVMAQHTSNRTPLQPSICNSSFRLKIFANALRWNPRSRPPPWARVRTLPYCFVLPFLEATGSQTVLSVFTDHYWGYHQFPLPSTGTLW